MHLPLHTLCLLSVPETSTFPLPIFWSTTRTSSLILSLHLTGPWPVGLRPYLTSPALFHMTGVGPYSFQYRLDHRWVWPMDGREEGKKKEVSNDISPQTLQPCVFTTAPAPIGWPQPQQYHLLSSLPKIRIFKGWGLIFFTPSAMINKINFRRKLLWENMRGGIW